MENTSDGPHYHCQISNRDNGCKLEIRDGAALHVPMIKTNKTELIKRLTIDELWIVDLLDFLDVLALWFGDVLGLDSSNSPSTNSALAPFLWLTQLGRPPASRADKNMTLRKPPHNEEEDERGAAVRGT